MSKLEVVIGIEIHLELNTRTKMFSSAIIDSTSKPNTNVSVIDLGYPGTLPQVNKQAVIHAIKLAKALNMKIDNELHFDRKHYFYPDLPKGFQITQQARPIATNGMLPIFVDGIKKEISLERIHLEEDTAKQIHVGNLSKLNYNRAGIPLIEIVTNPVMHSGEEAAQYVDTIRKLAKTLDISDAKMEEGSLRADINISLRSIGQKTFGTKVEIKNLNSISNIKKAIEYEIELQTKTILNKQIISMDTKRFDETKQQTITMRTKTTPTDYKYFSEPNIPIIKLANDFINNIKIGELPWEKRSRFENDGVPKELINQLLDDNYLSNYFDSIEFANRAKVAKLLFSEIVSEANSRKVSVPKLKISANEITKLLSLVEEGVISGKHVKKIIPLLVGGTNTSLQIIEKNNMKQLSDPIQLKKIIDNIIIGNPKFIGEYKTRPERVIKFVIGTLMRETKGQANPIVSTRLVTEALEEI